MGAQKQNGQNRTEGLIYRKVLREARIALVSLAMGGEE